MGSRDVSAAEQQNGGSRIWQRRIGILLIVFGCLCSAGKWAIDRVVEQTQEIATPEILARTIERLKTEHVIFALLGSAIAGGIWLVADSLSLMRQRTRSKAVLGVCLAICVIVVWFVVRDSNADKIRWLQRAILELETGTFGFP